MRVGRAGIATGLLALLAATGAAQGIGDAAARERAKREKASGGTAGPARLITNEDLEGVRPPGEKREAQAGAPAPAAGAEAAAEDAPSEDASSPSPFEDRNAALRPYLDAVTEAQARVGEIEARIRELQARLNPMSTTFIYGDHDAVGTDKVAEEAQVRSDLSEAEGQLSEARQAAAAAANALEDFKQGRPSASSARN